MTRVKVGVIGLGEVAQIIHLPILEMLSDKYEISAVCDISQGLLDVVGDTYGVEQRFTDAGELTALEDLDAVLVLNSDEYHTDCTVAAARAGKNVLVEKPMCLNLPEAEEIIRAREEGGVRVMVGYMRRYAPAFVQGVEEVRQLDTIKYARVRDLIGQNRLMIEQSSCVHRFDDIPREAAEDRARRARDQVREAIGDVPKDIYTAYRLLNGLSSHDISAMRELIGMPARVASAVQWQNGRYIAALLEFDGYYATFETGVDMQRRFDAHLQVYGETKSIRIQYDTPYIRHLPTTLVIGETVGDAYTESVLRPTFKDPYTCELEYFYEVVTQGVQPKTSPEDFKQDLEVFRMIVDALRA